MACPSGVGVPSESPLGNQSPAPGVGPKFTLGGIMPHALPIPIPLPLLIPLSSVGRSSHPVAIPPHTHPTPQAQHTVVGGHLRPTPAGVSAGGAAAGEAAIAGAPGGARPGRAAQDLRIPSTPHPQTQKGTTREKGKQGRRRWETKGTRKKEMGSKGGWETKQHIYIYIHTYMHTYIHTCIHTYIC